MKISAIRNNIEPTAGSFSRRMGSESNDSDLHEHMKSSKKARKNKRSTSAVVVAATSTLSTKMKTTSDEESECDEREKLKAKKRFVKAKVLSSPPPITLTLKKTSDSGAFLGESSTAHDNSYLSSSDNDLPALVKAAIKCVESDSGSNTEAAPAKVTQQYTSSLLQDYMEKTQLLAQDTSPPTKPKEVVKRKRGRPRKNANLVLETDSGEFFLVFHFLWSWITV